MNRIRTLPATRALMLASLLLVLVPGVSTALAAEKTPDIKLDLPEVTKGLRVAVLPVVNATSELDANKIMEDILREQFQEVPKERAMFLMPADVERVLSDANTDRADRVANRWSRYGTLDSTAVVGLDSLLVADAVLLIKISEWETKRAHNVGEGQSSTTIALHMALYSLRDKKKLWSKNPREQRLARELDITNSTVGYDETGRIQTPRANEPPRVDEVASDLVREALKKFPNK
jgi:hypothetical protein